MAGQTINDRLLAARHSLAGQGLAKSVCKATTEEMIGPKKKHLDCEYMRDCVRQCAKKTTRVYQLINFDQIWFSLTLTELMTMRFILKMPRLASERNENKNGVMWINRPWLAGGFLSESVGETRSAMLVARKRFRNDAIPRPMRAFIIDSLVAASRVKFELFVISEMKRNSGRNRNVSCGARDGPIGRLESRFNLGHWCQFQEFPVTQVECDYLRCS